MNATTKSDPTKTITLRKMYVQQFRHRFTAIKRASTQSIVQNDCFGLINSPVQAAYRYTKQQPFPLWKKYTEPVPYHGFAFASEAEKVPLFMNWLKTMQDNVIFQQDVMSLAPKDAENIWTNIYLSDGYKHGILWARNNVKNDKELMKHYRISDEDVKTDAESINTAFVHSTHMNRAALIFTRTYGDLNGISATMDGQISRILADGITMGHNPVKIAKEIAGRIDNIGIHRSTILARTEIVRAHHIASIQTYRDYGILGVQVKAEWQTAGDSRVCELCAPLDDKVYTLDEVEGKIPVHPQCRCAALPLVID